MKLMQTLLAVAVAVAAVAPNAFAQSTDLSITGRILPGACNVTLDGGGIADFGDISTRDLNEDAVTDLEPVHLAMNVTCESETRFAFQGVDNSGDSSITPDRYGLGLTPAEEKIGSANLRLIDTTLDGYKGYATSSTNNGESWSSSNDVPGTIGMNLLRGFNAESGTFTGPKAVETLQSTLEVLATIAPTNDLTFSGDVPINGSVTINLIYL